ncbi:cadmium zinc cobalt-transporting P-type ATPase [Lactobacillus selangorensis]|uniref:Cd(2+)-exporting ATPase n=1 Tax=Lactobacillus selangorensis TaxID=81857 RepID=A0A0R2FS42_9LACO|nr:cadmium zinc cobalt-transporting P-type ATPase [Lactobacillus selangorensis]KRN31453.1 cadmium zinc cobalt-transporting P-type ATPase [Lactobacillus selangorensis]
MFHLNWLAQLLITIMGGLLALTMLIEMIKTLRSGKYGVDLLAIIAIVSTLAIGQYWAALMILVMLTGGDSLEDYAAGVADRDLRSLLNNSPQDAHLLQKDGAIRDIEVDDVQVGDQLIVKPGELAPVDGKLLQGTTAMNESSLTGESLPVDKQPGDEIMSGSVNGDNSITMEAEKTAANSQYQAIVKLVKESETQPAKFVRMADRYAVPFTAISILIGAVAWIISGTPVRFAEVMVVASPCPLILAAPVALVAGMSRTSRNGVIVKNGDAIEKMASVKTVGFDKTGTLTQGNLAVVGLHPEKGYTEQQLLTFAASVEQQSSHILARSLVTAAGDDHLQPVSEVVETTGNGVAGQINGQLVKAGKAAYVAPGTPSLAKQTAVYVSVDGQFIGYITFADQLRPEAKKTIQALRQMGITHTMMVTGDHKTITDKIGQQVGIDDVHADMLPEDKIKIVQSTPKEQRPVMFVGDGINDAPTLRAADVGVAMGAHGDSAATESADVVILKDDLFRVVRAIDISKNTMKIARNDVLTGIAVLIVLMLIAACGVIPALVGAVFQEVVDTMTILLALRAKNEPKKDPYKELLEK